jgi:predicted nucleic acid-binding protein
VGILIDSSVLIEWERKKFDLAGFIRPRQNESFFISVITVSELLHGVGRARRPEMRMRRSAFVERIIAEFPALEIDIPTARLHGEISANLSSHGVFIPAQDLWIGCTAIYHGLSVWTCNLRDFKRIPGLTVEKFPAD